MNRADRRAAGGAGVSAIAFELADELRLYQRGPLPGRALRAWPRVHALRLLDEGDEPTAWLTSTLGTRLRTPPERA